MFSHVFSMFFPSVVQTPSQGSHGSHGTTPVQDPAAPIPWAIAMDVYD